MVDTSIELHRSREAFIETGHVHGVRRVIEDSWKRSQFNGVDPDGPPSVTVTDVDGDSGLVRAAAPVLDRLADRIVGLPMSLILSDACARIIDRRAGSRGLQDGLDRLMAVPGAAFDEESVGTNGLGTTVELREPFMVRGAEHFAEALKQLTCAGAPIIHPLTGRLEGILDITCPAPDSTPLMLTPGK